MSKPTPSIGNPTEIGARNPGDEAAPDSFQAGEMTCPECHGSGQKTDQAVCANCGGSGVVIRIVGDA